MDTRKIASEYRMAHWGGLLQKRAQSGQSIEEFCTGIGISRNTYFYWQRKLRGTACERLLEEKESGRDKLIPGGWTQLTPQEMAESLASVTIEVEGCRIQVTAETDLILLREICRVLKTL